MITTILNYKKTIMNFAKYIELTVKQCSYCNQIFINLNAYNNLLRKTNKQTKNKFVKFLLKLLNINYYKT